MVFRVEKTKNYTVMSNYHLREKSMSLKAKGLLSWMLSNVDDWDYSIAGIVSNSKENETSIKSALKELQEFGYLEIKKHMPESNENNEVIRSRIEYEYIIHEYPITNQDTEIQGVDFLCVENQVQRNTKERNTNKIKNISKDILQDVVTTEDNLTKLNSKLKSKGKNLYQKCLDLINDFTDNEELRHSLTECFKLFSENSRDAGMPFYANNFKGKLNTLAKLSTDTEMQIKIVQQTLDSGWQNFYAIKGDIKRKSSRYTTNEPTDMGYVVDRANRRGDIRGEKF